MHDARQCPRCGSPTDSLKAYRLPTFLLFLFIGASFRHGVVVGCPPCMRKELGRLALINILPANLLWFVLIAPWYSIAAFRSLTPGHSAQAPVTGLPVGGYRGPATAPQAPAAATTGKPWHDDPALRRYFGPDAPDDIAANFVLPGRAPERLTVRLLAKVGLCYRATMLEPSASEPGLHAGLDVYVKPSASHPPLAFVPPNTREMLESWEARCAQCGFDVPFNPALELAQRDNPAAHPHYLPSQLTDVCAACGGRLVLSRRAPLDVGAPPPKAYPFGLGATAELGWKVAFFATLLLGGVGTGIAGYGSESDGVSMALLSAFPIGATFGGWRMVHSARNLGRGLGWVIAAAIAGGFIAAFLVAFFFFGIFPSL